MDAMTLERRPRKATDTAVNSGCPDVSVSVRTEFRGQKAKPETIETQITKAKSLDAILHFAKADATRHFFLGHVKSIIADQCRKPEDIARVMFGREIISQPSIFDRLMDGSRAFSLRILKGLLAALKWEAASFVDEFDIPSIPRVIRMPPEGLTNREQLKWYSAFHRLRFCKVAGALINATGQTHLAFGHFIGVPRNGIYLLMRGQGPWTLEKIDGFLAFTGKDEAFMLEQLRHMED